MFHNYRATKYPNGTNTYRETQNRTVLYETTTMYAIECAKIRIGSGSSISTGIGTTSILKCVVLWFAQVDSGRMGS